MRKKSADISIPMKIGVVIDIRKKITDNSIRIKVGVVRPSFQSTSQCQIMQANLRVSDHDLVTCDNLWREAVLCVGSKCVFISFPGKAIYLQLQLQYRR